MKSRNRLAEVKTSDGGVLALYESDGIFSMNFNGQELMHQKASASEELLGELGAETLPDEGFARVLIGGLGLGFTLRSVLSHVNASTLVDVVELIPEVVEWNKTHLQSLNGGLLDDDRVTVRTEDVVALIRSSEAGLYDSILLDVDNGPVAMVAEGNHSLYSVKGIAMIRRALKAKGRAVFWSAGPDPKFEKRLRGAGFNVTAIPAKLHHNARRAIYVLFVADVA